MQITFKYKYSKEVIPPRCRKPRPEIFEGIANVEVKELDSDSFPVAFIVHNRVNKTEETICMDVSTRTLYTLDENCTVQMLLDNAKPQIYERYDQARMLDIIREHFSNLVIYNNTVWKKTSEPVYEIHTFGLGYNHGGTAVMLGKAGSMLSVSSYRADELDLAIQEATRIAVERKDTKSIETIESVKDWYFIEVIREDAIQFPLHQVRLAYSFKSRINTVLGELFGRYPDNIANTVVYCLWSKRQDLLYDRALESEVKSFCVNALSAYFNNQNDPLEDIADYMVKDGTKKTSTGSWCFYSEEIAEKFGIVFNETNKAGQKLLDILSKREEVAQVDIINECIDICFYTGYCGIQEPELMEIAIWMVETGINSTNSGYWTFYFDELDEKFSTDFEHNPSEVKKLVGMLKQRAEVDEIHISEDNIELSFVENLPAGE